MQQNINLNYRPEIDGLRTLAIIPVILFHLDYSFIKGGYYGVDVFFVISGYLITNILIAKIESNQFSMYNFWIRRIKRLLPMVITVVFFSLLASIVLSIYKPTIQEIAKDTFPAIFSFFNIYALYNFGDYWGGEAKNSFFLHTWSLSVEEQFYLLYPLFLFFCHKIFKSFLLPLVFLTVLSFFFFAYYLNINKDFTFYMLPTRIWELSIGGVISIFFFKAPIKKSILNQILPIIGIILIMIGYFFGRSDIDMMVIFPVIGTVFILFFCNGNDIISKILSIKPFLIIGKLSYSLYLWHWVVILLFRNSPELLSIYSRATIFIITLLLSLISYYTIENKTRNFKGTPKMVLVGITLLCSIGIFLNSDYYDTKYGNKFTINKTPELIDYSKPENNKAYTKKGIYKLVNGKSPEVLILGDSHAVALSRTIDDICEDLHLSRTFFCKIGLRANINLTNINNQIAYSHDKDISIQEKIAYAKSIKKALDEWDIKLVIISMRWDIRGIENYEDLFNYITEKRNIKLLIINQPPMINYGLLKAGEEIDQKLTYTGYKGVKNMSTYVDYNGEGVFANNKKVSNFSKEFKNTYIFDLYSTLTKGKKMLLINDNKILYKDTNHISEFGASFIKQKLEKEIEEILKD